MATKQVETTMLLYVWEKSNTYEKVTTRQNQYVRQTILRSCMWYILPYHLQPNDTSNFSMVIQLCSYTEKKIKGKKGKK